MSNLFALCGQRGSLKVKRVALTQPVQTKLEGFFKAQATAFMDGIVEEIEFGSDWKPDADELLVLEAPNEVAVIMEALAVNPISLPNLDASNFQGENIKALFLSAEDGGHKRILIQLFSAQQILARRFSLLLDGNSFKELTEPAFTLDNYLVAIIEDEKLKFKNFHNLKRIFELKQFYQEASDQEIDQFCAHGNLEVADVAAFKAVADQPIRKMLHAISKTNVLNTYAVDDIAQKASSLGLNVKISGGKLVIPSEKKDIKNLFRFLDDGIYEALLSSNKYVTNSKRLFGS